MKMFSLLGRPADLGLDVFADRFRAMLDGCEGCPVLDLYEGAQGWTMHVELPGVRPEDVQVHVENGVLSLSVEKKVPETKDLTPLLRERSFGTIRREVSLPDGVDAEKIEARFQDGVLTLALPKREDAKPKRIEIKVV